jgi:phospholipid/cholesterol/gamma-HCH transport system substrate-binding protein
LLLKEGRELFSTYQTFYAEYDSVEGLANSAPVTLNGLVIGKVTVIKINQVTGKLMVEMQVKTDFPISKSSAATLYEPSFIGGKQIAIEPNYKDKVLAEDGQMLQTNVRAGLTESLGNQLGPIQKKLEKIMTNADVLISGINNVLDKKRQEDLKVSLSELSQTMIQFHKASASMNVILDENKTQIKGVVTLTKFQETLHKYLIL